MGLPTPDALCVLIPQWILISIAAGIIGARLYLRLSIQRTRLSWSDILICGAWLTSVGMASIDAIYARMGVLNPDVTYSLAGFSGTPEALVLMPKLIWASHFPFHTTVYLCKAALLDFYKKLFPLFMKKRRMALCATTGYCVCAYVATILLNVCVCGLPESDWIHNPDKTCSRKKAEQIYQIAWSLHFAGDIMIFTLPFLVLHGLKMKKAVRIGVYGTFLLGIISMAFSLTRFLTVQIAAKRRLSVALVELWGALDINIGLVVACLPSLRPYCRLASQHRDKSLTPSKIPTLIPSSLRTEGGRGALSLDERPYWQQWAPSASPRPLHQNPSIEGMGGAWNDRQRSEVELMPAGENV